MPRWWYYYWVSITIVKADGSSEYFKVEKLRRSLRRAGASTDEISTVITDVEAHLHERMTTQEIYRYAFEQLRHYAASTAARYSLRRALFGLGPTGFPFEAFLARLFTAEGYEVRTGITLSGKCVDHEIDVAAFDATSSFIAEAKFHSRPGIKSDLQVAMYSYARFLDLQQQRICTEDHCGINSFWIITNTKFTSSAERYALCSGLQLLSWDYPKRNNLHDRIQRSGLYPITVLRSLTTKQTSMLIERGVIVCQDIIDRPSLLRHLHLSTKKTESLLAEANALRQTDFSK